MAQIFLSYSHSDSDFVALIEPRIARIFGEGKMWYDRSPDGLKGGQIWWSRIKAEIHSCQLFLFLLSDASAVSCSCTKELREALVQNKTIIPVFLETYISKDYPDTYPQSFLQRLKAIQYVDLRNSQKRIEYDDLSELWGAINRAQRPRLTPVERWILYNQYEIIKTLEVDNRSKKHYETEIQQSLLNGYVLANLRLMPMFEEEFSFNDCKEVEDILWMFHAIELAKQDFWRIGTSFDFELVDEFFLNFIGFDGHFESKQMQFARYLMKDCRNFETVIPKNDDFNSGTPQMPRYRRMMSAWRKSTEELKLTNEDLVRILEAAKNSGSDCKDGNTGNPAS